MKRNRYIVSLLATMVVLGTFINDSLAEEIHSTTIFAVVTEIQPISKRDLKIKGEILSSSGDLAETEMNLDFGSEYKQENCLKFALMAMARAGRYQLVIFLIGDDWATFGYKCSLKIAPN